MEKKATVMKKMILLNLALLAGSASLLGQGVKTAPLPRPAPQFTWNQQSAAHLMRRAGFSASPAELDSWVEKGFLASLDELVRFQEVDDSAMEAGLAARNFRLSRTNQNGMQIANAQGMNQWWLYRMMHSRRQLLEKMTLFWHDHFATSVGEIRFVKSTGQPLLLVQQDLLRQYAVGNFKEMVHQIARDPAMLIWLDNFINFNESPNENWGRELLELFTMGVDQYTQVDIEEAARAFTGWTLNRRSDNFEFIFVERLHDFGEKTFLGKTGAFDGDDIIDIIFEQEVTAQFMARKLWEFFVYPDPSDQLVRDLGRVFRDSGYETSVLMRAIFRHPEFFSTRAYRALMKSPVEMVVNFMREMELDDPATLPPYLFNMNQLLFFPPDVGGWTSGVGWVNTSTLLFRYNFFNIKLACRGAAFCPGAGRDGQPDPVDLAAIIQAFGLQSGDDLTVHFGDRLLQGDLTPDEEFVLQDYLTRGEGGAVVEFDINNPLTVDEKVRGLIYLITIMPAYQLN